jgi:hypothetical protein
MRAGDNGTYFQLELMELQLYDMRNRMTLYFLLSDSVASSKQKAALDSVYGQSIAIHDSVLVLQRSVASSHARIDSAYESVIKAEKDYARAGADKLWLYCLVAGTFLAGAGRVWRVVREDLHKSPV